MVQACEVVFLSAKPSSPWPVAPCPPRNDNDRSAARHGDDDETAVVVTVVVVVVGLLTGVLVVEGAREAPESVTVVRTVVVVEPPQPVSATSATTTGIQRAFRAISVRVSQAVSIDEPAPPHRRPPGTQPSPRPRRKIDWELVACGFQGHHLVGTEAAELRLEDAILADDQGQVRWHRCLRCDSWVALPRPEMPTRRYPPERSEITIPLRGKALRDKVVLRVIAIDRAFHFIILALLGAAVLLFAAHEGSLKNAFYRVMTDLQGGVAGGPVQNSGHVGILRELDRLFSLRSGTLHVVAIALIAYALLEGTEAVGLWLGKRWAEYLTFVATTILLPLEIYEIIYHRSALKIVGFLINLAVVVYLLYAKRLFGLRGGGAVDESERARDVSWQAIERATPPALIRGTSPR